MKWAEQAQKLLRKAGQDERALTLLSSDETISDEVVGFHAQQAVEKLLKSLLCKLQIPYRRTHDLTELIQLLEGADIEIPPVVAESRRLGPYAVEFRYEDVLSGSAARLDRDWAVGCVEQTRDWVIGFQ